MPGVGPAIAITVALIVNPQHFASGRHFAAWLGLTPKEHSTGGKQRLGRISKAGHMNALDPHKSFRIPLVQTGPSTQGIR